MTSSDFVAEPGDIFACWGTDLVSRIISLEGSSLLGPSGLRWGPSHVAIASHRSHWQSGSECYWFESTSLSARACLQAGRRVSGVQVHGISDRAGDYIRRGGSVVVYRLTGIDTLSEAEQLALRRMLHQFLGTCDVGPVRYDTVGAICSGTRYIRRFTAWRNQLDNLFCSELIAAVLQRLGKLCRRNPADFTPARLLRSLVTQGTYREFLVLKGELES